jgi:alpha-glucosidase (family GH31 glycosyl hydrolase)
MAYYYRLLLLHLAFLLALTKISNSQTITANGQPAQLDIRKAGENSIRVTLKPVSYTNSFPYTPAVVERNYAAPVFSLRNINTAVKKKVGNLTVEVKPSPLSVIVTNGKNEIIQQLVFESDGNLSFAIGDKPVLGLGEGGPQPTRDVPWRTAPVQYDRRGAMDSMLPRWQRDMYGSRNPVAMLVGTGGWAVFVATPWVLVDMRDKEKGLFIPYKPADPNARPQTHGNQQQNNGKGVHPIDKIVPGLFDLFVFDAHDPARLMKDFSYITGPAAMPPKWALGYMQSHRTLIDEYQMIGIVDTFRNKKIPVDAVIYLGTGFCPRGWNTRQPSFDPNPEVFQRQPKEFFADIHKRNAKVIVHMVPWDRDKLPTLQGNIPAKPGEIVNASHLQTYWKEHVPLMQMGVDGFWPDEGDWFDLFERIKRHQLYYQGQLSSYPNLRPWSLQRNGYPGIAQWGGWVWSGDTESSWKTLEAQIAVGLNYSLSIGPFWGTDIGGFFSNPELTGELYTRWYQFAAFCGSFRSHGRTWRTRLPWGWGLNYMGPAEDREPPLMTELNNPAIEPVVKSYDELRYQLLSYNYTLAWEARTTGLPMMRALWLHYPDDVKSTIADEYLWGKDLLIAPVYAKGATSRAVYLPKGDWYDWWTNEKQTGGQTITRNVDLSIMPIYARAGSIIVIDPVRQYTSEVVNGPETIKVYQGANGQYTLYEDDGNTQEYLKGKATLTSFAWDDKAKKLSIKPDASKQYQPIPVKHEFNIQLIPSGTTKTINYTGKPVSVSF